MMNYVVGIATRRVTLVIDNGRRLEDVPRNAGKHAGGWYSQHP